ncbi:MAG TPA: iron ABC transporter permease [Sphingomonadales bacterium]|nr:iron ABC transporter permease [Sphingomonadales bacterium]
MTPNSRNQLLCLIALIITGIFSLSFGRVTISPADMWVSLTAPSNSPHAIILFELRLPRVLLGMMVGATLGLAGAALQGVLRNPLADPGVIGVSSSAALGAVIAIHFGMVASWSLALPVFAMTGALVATTFLLLVSVRDSSVLMLILVGIGISSLATALISLVMNMAASPMSLRDMIMWILGSLQNRTMTDLMMAMPFILIGWLMMVGVGQGLNAISVGEDTARTLGINLRGLKLRIVVGTAISVGAAVSVCGSIGFIGLVVPHITRVLFSREPGAILIPSALMGALLLTLADVITRLPFAGAPLQLGVVTALIGAPCFLYIVFHTRKDMR